jgi:hypothetical protein
VIAVITVLFGARVLWQRWKSGWKLDPDQAEAHTLSEG